MKIIEARKTDSSAIARAIMMAVGSDICKDLAGEDHTLADVELLFTRLAEREDTQYSYLNALVALDDDGAPIGVCVGYDGAGLYEMRERFFALAKEILDKDYSDVDDETDASEFYIDTLAVLPKHRGKGVATALLKAMVERARKIGKPAGLLVDKQNSTAAGLYDKVGFRKVGERPFCYVLMDHLQFKNEDAN